MPSTTAPDPVRTEVEEPAGRRIPFAVIAIATLVLCAAVSALPATMPWWPLKLAVATYTVLLLPGAVILRILGWPRSPAAALAASGAWSIAALAPGLVLVFLFDQRLDLAVAWLVLVVVVGLIIGRGRPVEMDTRVTGPILVTLAVTAGFCVLLALARHHNAGDALEHIARIRKLTELVSLRGLAEINLLPPETGMHPGYAFPLWHATVGLLVRLTGVDEALLFRSLPVLLVPLVTAATYRAGRALFGCSAAGAAVWISYLALFAFPDFGVGLFERLAYPGFVSIFLLWPLVVDRGVVYLRDGGREPIWTIVATSFVVAVIHPSYSPLMMLVIGAFVATRFVIRRDVTELRRMALLVAALSLPFLVLLVWLYPIAKSGGVTATNLNSFATLVDRADGLVRMKPSWVTRGGAAHIAALLLVPIAAGATRTRAAAFIAGGVAAVTLVLIVPWVFTPFSDVMSISQARRLLYYMPWAFSLVGGALVLARFHYFAVAGALVAGTVLQLLAPGDFEYTLKDPGPGWVAWFAAVAAIAVIAAGAAGKLHLRYQERWALPVVAAFVVPIAIAGLLQTPFGRRDGSALPRPVLAAVRANVDRDDVVMATDSLAYRLVAHAPVYVTAVKKGHSADTFVNQHAQRRADVAKFFKRDVSTTQAEDILERWDVQWLLIEKGRPYPQDLIDELTPVFEGGKYALYAVEAPASG